MCVRGLILLLSCCSILKTYTLLYLSFQIISICGAALEKCSVTLVVTEFCNQDVDWNRSQGPNHSSLNSSTLASNLFPVKIKELVLICKALYGLGAMYLKNSLFLQNPIRSRQSSTEVFCFMCPCLLRLGGWPPGKGPTQMWYQTLKLSSQGGLSVPFCHHLVKIFVSFGVPSVIPTSCPMF